MLSRRSAMAQMAAQMGGLAAAAAAPLALSSAFAPLAARDMQRAPRLRLGDTVGLIAPAGFMDDAEQIDAIRHAITGMGLVPKIGRHVLERHGYLAGTDQQRADDFHAMYADDDVRAVFAVRGGWGCARLLPLLDWDLIRAHPKLLIGYSDITALHLAFAARAGFATIHAPNAGGRWLKASWDSLWRLAFTGETPLLGGTDTDRAGRAITTLRPGLASGRLLGGNLTVLSALVGTPWLPDWDGAILFLEDVGEAEYRIDRMFSQLQLAGVLDRLAGVVFGQCTRCSADVPDYIGFTIPQILDHYLTPLGIPAFHGANIGHVSNQLSLPFGARVEMDGLSGTLHLLEPVVA